MSEKKVKISKVPKKFWKDEAWGFAHRTELTKKYPDKWVSIFNQKVIFANEDLSIVEEKTKKKLASDMFPIIFMECGNNIY